MLWIPTPREREDAFEYNMPNYMHRCDLEKIHPTSTPIRNNRWAHCNTENCSQVTYVSIYSTCHPGASSKGWCLQTDCEMFYNPLLLPFWRPPVDSNGGFSPKTKSTLVARRFWYGQKTSAYGLQDIVELQFPTSFNSGHAWCKLMGIRFQPLEAHVPQPGLDNTCETSLPNWALGYSSKTKL